MSSSVLIALLLLVVANPLRSFNIYGKTSKVHRLKPTRDSADTLILQFSDIHYDPVYKNYCNTTSDYGEYDCDSPLVSQFHVDNTSH